MTSMLTQRVGKPGLRALQRADAGPAPAAHERLDARLWRVLRRRVVRWLRRVQHGMSAGFFCRLSHASKAMATRALAPCRHSKRLAERCIRSEQRVALLLGANRCRDTAACGGGRGKGRGGGRVGERDVSAAGTGHLVTGSWAQGLARSESASKSSSDSMMMMTMMMMMMMAQAALDLRVIPTLARYPLRRGVSPGHGLGGRLRGGF
eukprot:3238064-Rhodomonas_salina.2